MCVRLVLLTSCKTSDPKTLCQKRGKKQRLEVHKPEFRPQHPCENLVMTTRVHRCRSMGEGTADYRRLRALPLTSKLCWGDGLEGFATQGWKPELDPSCPARSWAQPCIPAEPYHEAGAETGGLLALHEPASQSTT